MKEFLFVSDRLDDITRELGVSNYSGFLEETQRKVRKIIVDERFHIDIVLHSSASSEVRKQLASLKEEIASENIFNINEITEKKELVRVFEQLFPSVAIVMFDEDFFNESILLNHVQHMGDEYRVVIFINFFDDDTLVKQVAQKLTSKTKTFAVPVAESKGKKLVEVLQPLLDTDKLSKLKKVAYINSIKPIFSFLTDIFASETKIIQTRKLLNSQNTLITKKEEVGYNVSELSTNAKQSVQKLIGDLEKSYKLKYDELNKPNTGKFSQISVQLTDKLLDFDHKELAEKSERVAISVKPDFLKNFNDEIIASLKTELSKDEVFIKSSFQDLLTRINIQLKAKGLKTIEFADVNVNFPDQERVLRSFCYFAKQFNGELMKRGATEYFVALRDYIGVIMVATGLLGPLNMIANIEGTTDDKASMWRRFLKAFATDIKLATAVIAFSLIIYGIFDLKKRIPRKREEEFEREMTKAREVLQNEARRMYNESSREWISNISNWIKEVNQNINQELEKSIKDFQYSKSSQATSEKQQQQRLQQSIDLIQRNIQSAEKVKDQLFMRFRDVVTETEKDLKL